MDFQNGAKNIPAAGYNGARTVPNTKSFFKLYDVVI